MIGVDWRARHGRISGPVHAVTGLTAAAAIGSLPVLDVTPGAVIGGGVLASGVVVLRSRAAGLSWPGLSLRVGSMIGGSAWLAHALSEGWSLGAAGTLLGGAAAVGALWPAARRRDQVAAELRAEADRRAAEAAADAAEQDELHDLADRWIRLIEKTCGIRVQITAIEHWQWPGPDGSLRETGYTLQAVLPATGVTVDRIRSHQDGLASAARLPMGCGVEVLQGTNRGTVLIDVNTYDALQDVIPLPLVDTPRSIADPLDIGVRRNGAPARIRLLYESGALIGETGSGKTNELLTVLARYLECCDTLALVIDHNGGAVALPWLTLWVNREIKRPPILWVSDNDAESEMLCAWLIAVIEHRKRAYHGANMARNDDKLAPSPQVPHLLLVVDEFASLPTRVQDQIIQISNRGRAAAVRTLVCGLRGTADSLPRVLTKQARTKIAMQTDDDDELRYFFAQSAGKLKALDAPAPGYGFVAVDKEPAVVFKGYRVVPSMIEEVARRTDAWRPELDDSTLNMSAEWRRVFEDRWERCEHLLAAVRGNGGDAPGPSQESAPGTTGAPAAHTQGPPAPPHPGGMRGILDDINAAVERLRDSTNQASTSPTDGKRDAAAEAAEFDAIVSGQTVVPELLVVILAAMDDQPRMHTEDIARRIGARVETLGQLLSKAGIRPLPNAFTLGGRTKRGYRRVDVEAAADRIRRGELVPPDEVVRWRPELPTEWD